MKRLVTYTPFDSFIYGLSYGGHIKGWIESKNKIKQRKKNKHTCIRLEQKQMSHKLQINVMIYLTDT